MTDYAVSPGGGHDAHAGRAGADRQRASNPNKSVRTTVGRVAGTAQHGRRRPGRYDVVDVRLRSGRPAGCPQPPPSVRSSGGGDYHPVDPEAGLIPVTRWGVGDAADDVRLVYDAEGRARRREGFVGESWQAAARWRWAPGEPGTPVAARQWSSEGALSADDRFSGWAAGSLRTLRLGVLRRHASPGMDAASDGRSWRVA